MQSLENLIQVAGVPYHDVVSDDNGYASTISRFHQYLKKQQKKEHKIAVEIYREYIELLTIIHKQCSTEMAWDNWMDRPEPKIPVCKGHYQQLAQQQLAAYKPTWSDQLFNTNKSKTLLLLKAIERAKTADTMAHNEAIKQFKKEAKDWRKVQKIAVGLLAEDPEAYQAAIEFFKPFALLEQLGVNAMLNCVDGSTVIDLLLEKDKIVPNYMLSLALNGKLIKKKMPASQVNLLFHDFLCSCVLRVAREMFELLPIELLAVNVSETLRCSLNGKNIEQHILMVEFTRTAFERLRFEEIEGSIALLNFAHSMKFDQNQGFSPIDKA